MTKPVKKHLFLNLPKNMKPLLLKFKAKLKQAEERAAFFEKAYKQEQAKNAKLQQQQKAD